jgi:hypothetical protein
MLAELNERLARLRERLSDRERLSARRASARWQRDALESELERHRQTVEHERRDVERLEGLGLTALFATLLGDKLEKLRVEQKELLAAKLKYDECFERAASLDRDLDGLNAALAELEGVEGEREAALAEKEQWLRQHGGEGADELFAFAEEEGRLAAERRELAEALEAGEEARDALSECRERLGSAKGWGTFDMLGGGLISTLAKHSHVDRARDCAARAQAALARFGRELEDVGERGDLAVELESFTRFADWFFDNLIVDWMVQSKILRSLQSVEEAIDQVDAVLARVDAQWQRTAAELERVAAERRRRVEEWA